MLLDPTQGLSGNALIEAANGSGQEQGKESESNVPIDGIPVAAVEEAQTVMLAHLAITFLDLPAELVSTVDKLIGIRWVGAQQSIPTCGLILLVEFLVSPQRFGVDDSP